MSDPDAPLLALDTTTRDAGVALLVGDTLRAVRRARVTTHSEALLTMVQEVLAEAGVAPRALAAIACAAGPGSFTGLRIGLATAKGLCLALARPLVLVPSLEALAARPPAGAQVMACLDALKGEVYAAAYLAGLPPLPLGAEAAVTPARLLEQLLRLAAAGPVHLVGDGVLRFPALRAAGVIADDTTGPDPADVARLARRRLARGEIAVLASAAPRYVRASEAEIVAALRSAGAVAPALDQTHAKIS